MANTHAYTHISCTFRFAETNAVSFSFYHIGQFTEDGSFIGQYVPGKLQPPVSPQPLNNAAAAHQQQPGIAAEGSNAAGAGSSGSSSTGGGGAASTNTAAVATYV